MRRRTWPLEIEHTPSGERHPVVVVSVETPDGGVELVLDGAEASIVPTLRAAGVSYEAALIDLWRQLDGKDLLLLCNRYRDVAARLGAGRGIGCYLTPWPLPVRPAELVDSLGPAPRHTVLTHGEATRRRRRRERLDRMVRVPGVEPILDAVAARRGARNRAGAGDEVRMEPLGRPPEREPGLIVRARFAGSGPTVFATVVGVDGDRTGVGLRFYRFVVATPDTVPALLFTPAHLTAETLSLQLVDWGTGCFAAVDATGSWPDRPAPPVRWPEPLPLDRFAEAIGAQLDIGPSWLLP